MNSSWDKQFVSWDKQFVGGRDLLGIFWGNLGIGLAVR